MPFSHDEAATFFRFVQVGEFAPEYSREAFNNHFLNTILAYFSYNLFGDSKLALRLPNILGYLIYLYYLFKTAQFLTDKYLRWSFLLVLCFTHYFIEFFAVSRGYGLSMAFLLAMIYYLIKAQKTRKPVNHLLASFFGTLMVSANLNTIVPFIAIFGLQALALFSQMKDFSNRRKWLIPLDLVIDIAVIVTVYRYMTLLNENGAFYLGSGENSFFEVTIKSLLQLLTGNVNLVAFVILFTLLLAIAIVLVRQIILLKFNFFLSHNMVFPVVFVSSVAGIIMIVHLFGVNYPEDRAALYLFPLFAGSLFFVFDLVRKKFKWLIRSALILFLFFPLHFLAHVNSSYIYGYKNEALPERWYKIIADEHGKTGILPTIGGSNMRQFAWTYLNYINGGTENMVDWNGYPDTISQYQILQKEVFPLNLNAYDSIDFATYSGLTLFKRKRSVSLKLVKVIDGPESGKMINNRYYNFFKTGADTMVNKQYYFDFNFRIISDQIPFDAWLVIQVENKEHQALVYKYIPFNWLKTKWEEDSDQFHQSIFLGSIPEGSKVIKAFIWNKRNGAFQTESGKIKIFELKKT